MKNPKMRSLRCESLVSNQPVMSELEVLEDLGDTLIVRTWGKNYRRLTKDVDKNGVYWKVYELYDYKETI